MNAGIIGQGNIDATAAPCLEYSAYLSRLGRADERTRTAFLLRLHTALLLDTMWRAASTVSRGMPESGTGTATHSPRGLGAETTFLGAFLRGSP
jgi:hypothetical protein